jgi:ArsR family transcriptional regulator
MCMSVDVEAPAVDLLRVLAEPIRWRILELLGAEELCVCHMVEELGVSQPLVSHHLKVLREAGLVTSSRFRYWTYYRLLPGALAPLADALGTLAGGGSTDGVADGARRRPCC